MTNEIYVDFPIRVSKCPTYGFWVLLLLKTQARWWWSSSLFWTDRWLHGRCIADIAPHLFALIPKRRANKRTVLEGHTNQTWILDLQGALCLMWNSLSSATLCLMWNYSLVWRILIFGNSAQVDSIQQNWHIGVYSRDQWDYSLGRGSGRLGHRPNVASSCGLSYTIDAGQQIG